VLCTEVQNHKERTLLSIVYVAMNVVLLPRPLYSFMALCLRKKGTRSSSAIGLCRVMILPVPDTVCSSIEYSSSQIFSGGRVPRNNGVKGHRSDMSEKSVSYSPSVNDVILDSKNVKRNGFL
jgi:hypothetical protein